MTGQDNMTVREFLRPPDEGRHRQARIDGNLDNGHPAHDDTAAPPGAQHDLGSSHGSIFRRSSPLQHGPLAVHAHMRPVISVSGKGGVGILLKLRGQVCRPLRRLIQPPPSRCHEAYQRDKRQQVIEHFHSGPR
jgi:hypothetical protein